jgi:hypothetical protein
MDRRHDRETDDECGGPARGSDGSAGATGPLVTVMVADHNRMVAAVYRAAATHKVQVRSLRAAWMIGMGARCPQESTGSKAQAKLSTLRSPWADPSTCRPPLVNSITHAIGAQRQG